MIWIRISDPRSLGSRFIKGTDESTLVTDSSVPLMHYDPSDLGSLNVIQIIPKECISSKSSVSKWLSLKNGCMHNSTGRISIAGIALKLACR